jgi:Tfp pilus assembly protein PilN
MKAVNLIPSEQRGGASVGTGRSEGAVFAVIALLLGVAVLGVLYGKASHKISASNGEVASLTAQAQQAQAEASQLAPFASFVSLREQRMQAVTQLVDSRFDWAHVFHEFGRVLPPEASISSLTGTVGSAATTSTSAGKAGASASSSASVASSTPVGSVPTFTIAGCATSQAAVALTLERLRLIDGVSNVSLQSSTATVTGGGSGAGSGAATVSGGCPASDPVFNIQITFEALPQPSASTPTTVTASNSTAGVR